MKPGSRIALIGLMSLAFAIRVGVDIYRTVDYSQAEEIYPEAEELVFQSDIEAIQLGKQAYIDWYLE